MMVEVIAMLSLRSANGHRDRGMDPKVLLPVKVLEMAKGRGWPRSARYTQEVPDTSQACGIRSDARRKA